MNGLMARKKKYRFQVGIVVEELQHVPFVNQTLFAKVRLLDGGYVSHSKRVMVQDHMVRWEQKFSFPSKMTANASTGELDSCICRVSVRQEVRGGRSFQKLGYADINLAEFAGAGGCRRYLLEAYDTKHRLHNSTLKVTVNMTLASGDPLFKTQSRSSGLQVDDVEPSVLPSDRPTSGSLASLSSGYDSLTKKVQKVLDNEESTETNGELPGHSRNSSNTSQGSQASGYASITSHSEKPGHASEAILTWMSGIPQQQIGNFHLYTEHPACQAQLPLSQGQHHVMGTAPTSFFHLPSSPSQVPNNEKGKEKKNSPLNFFKRRSVPSSSPSLTPQKGLVVPDGPAHYRKLSVGLTCQRSLDSSTNFYTVPALSKSMLAVPFATAPNTPKSVKPAATNCLGNRSASLGSGGLNETATSDNTGSFPRTKCTSGEGNKESRVNATRFDVNDLVDQLLQNTIDKDIIPVEGGAPGLSLIISKDGTPAVGEHISMPGGEFRPVIIDKR